MKTANYKSRCYLTISRPINWTCSLLSDHLGDLETSIDFAIAFQEAVESPEVALSSKLCNPKFRMFPNLETFAALLLIESLGISKLVKTKTSQLVFSRLSSRVTLLQSDRRIKEQSSILESSIKMESSLFSWIGSILGLIPDESCKHSANESF